MRSAVDVDSTIVYVCVTVVVEAESVEQTMTVDVRSAVDVDSNIVYVCVTVDLDVRLEERERERERGRRKEARERRWTLKESICC